MSNVAEAGGVASLQDPTALQSPGRSRCPENGRLIQVPLVLGVCQNNCHLNLRPVIDDPGSGLYDQGMDIRLTLRFTNRGARHHRHLKTLRESTLDSVRGQRQSFESTKNTRGWSVSERGVNMQNDELGRPKMYASELNATLNDFGGTMLKKRGAGRRRAEAYSV